MLTRLYFLLALDVNKTQEKSPKERYTGPQCLACIQKHWPQPILTINIFKKTQDTGTCLPTSIWVITDKTCELSMQAFQTTHAWKKRYSYNKITSL